MRGPVLIHGVDFTSVPRGAKPITIASGRLDEGEFHLSGIDEIVNFIDFEHWLRRPGPWVAGFDFPFGLPREAVQELQLPDTLPALTQHCAALGREGFRSLLDGYRAPRPVGAKFCYRRGDALAGAHSPLKLVNPPVALMFLEGMARVVAAGLSVPGMLAGDPNRIALEAYPGFAVRQLLDSGARVSYKNDARTKQTPVQRRMRERILAALTATDSLFGFTLVAAPRVLRAMRADARGDCLDAVLCALQAAWGWQRRRRGYGMPTAVDPIEGWIVTVPGAGITAPPPPARARPGAGFTVT